jgi:hypothetical protein
MTDVTQIHEEKETLTVDVNIPGHEPRKTTALFERTRKALIARAGGRCFICNATAEESGHPLEAHHHPIERSFAEMIDWDRFKFDAQAGVWGEAIKAFDWDHFTDWTQFVDDMTVNGMLLCKAHHIGKDEGMHALPKSSTTQHRSIHGSKLSSRHWRRRDLDRHPYARGRVGSRRHVPCAGTAERVVACRWRSGGWRTRQHQRREGSHPN